MGVRQHTDRSVRDASGFPAGTGGDGQDRQNGKGRPIVEESDYGPPPEHGRGRGGRVGNIDDQRLIPGEVLLHVPVVMFWMTSYSVPLSSTMM